MRPLRTALVLGPQNSPPLYIFTLGNDRFVAVNTKTGKVAELQ